MAPRGAAPLPRASARERAALGARPQPQQALARAPVGGGDASPTGAAGESGIFMQAARAAPRARPAAAALSLHSGLGRPPPPFSPPCVCLTVSSRRRQGRCAAPCRAARARPPEARPSVEYPLVLDTRRRCLTPDAAVPARCRPAPIRAPPPPAAASGAPPRPRPRQPPRAQLNPAGARPPPAPPARQVARPPARHALPHAELRHATCLAPRRPTTAMHPTAWPVMSAPPTRRLRTSRRPALLPPPPRAAGARAGAALPRLVYSPL
jgi:hypothetical protein